MKKSIAFLLFALFCQSDLFAKRVSGRIIYKDNDTVDVAFELPLKSVAAGNLDYYQMQEGVSYYSGNNLIAVSPGEVKEIQFKDGWNDIRMLPCLFPGKDGNYRFLTLVMDGDLKLFTYIYVERVSGGVDASGNRMPPTFYHVKSYVFQKNDQAAMVVSKTGFRYDVAAYLSDCYFLSQKVRNGEFNADNLAPIVDYYNTKCRKGGW